MSTKSGIRAGISLRMLGTLPSEDEDEDSSASAIPGRLDESLKLSIYEHDAIDATEDSSPSMPIDIALSGGWSGCEEREGRP